MKSEEDKDRNHDKKAIAADSWYLVHNFTPQNPPEASSRLVTLAVEQDAANDRNESTYETSLLFDIIEYDIIVSYTEILTQSPMTTIERIPGWRAGRLTKTENTSTTANVKLHGITNPIIVTKKLQPEFRQLKYRYIWE